MRTLIEEGSIQCLSIHVINICIHINTYSIIYEHAINTEYLFSKFGKKESL